jgi:hypothetical protein
LKPHDPESKGIVERVNRYLETSFLPGRGFYSPEDFNAQLDDWLSWANGCLVVRPGQRPLGAIAFDQKTMFALPPIAPVLGVLGWVRLARLLSAGRLERLLGLPERRRLIRRRRLRARARSFQRTRAQRRGPPAQLGER